VRAIAAAILGRCEVPSRRRLLIGAASLLVVATTGCVLPDQLSQIQKDLADVQQELRTVQKDQAASEDRLKSIEAKLPDGTEDRVARSEFADLKLQIEDQSRQLAVLTEQVNDANRRVDRMTDDLEETRQMTRRLADLGVAAAAGAAAGEAIADGATEATDRPGTTASPERSAGGPLPDPDALYNAAYADFSKGNYVLAIGGFEEYAERFPETALADNALYWVGECYYSQGSFDRAIESFDRMLERYPESDRAAAANLKKGLAYLENNAVAQAIVQLRLVVDAYGSTDEARIARDRLVSLGVSMD